MSNMHDSPREVVIVPWDPEKIPIDPYEGRGRGGGPPLKVRSGASVWTGLFLGLSLGLIIMAALFLTLAGLPPRALMAAFGLDVMTQDIPVPEVTRIVEVTAAAPPPPPQGTPEPVIMVQAEVVTEYVEVTRVLEVQHEVEVTRVVEVPREVEVTRIVEVPVTVVVTPTPLPRVRAPNAGSGPALPGLIPFASPNDPAVLNPVLGWQPGGSPASGYDLTLQPGVLTLVVGPGTDQWNAADSAPLVAYPFEGDFEAQVTITFDPNHQWHKWQFASLGVRESQTHKTWSRISLRADGRQRMIALYGNVQGRGFPIQQDNWPAYSPYSVSFRLERRGALLTFSYSENGVNWVVLVRNHVFALEEAVEVFVNAYSTSGQGMVVQFSDFTVRKR